jgi:hypothetical protein
VQNVEGHYDGPGTLICGDTVAEVVVHLQSVREVVPAPSATNPDRVALGRGAWYGRITGGEIDVWAAMHTGQCVIRLPNGRDGSVRVEADGSVLVGSGLPPFDPDLST